MDARAGEVLCLAVGKAEEGESEGDDRWGLLVIDCGEDDNGGAS